MLPEPDAPASGRTWNSRIDQLDPRVIKGGDQLHERIDIAADDAVTGFHALDRRHREVCQSSHLPLIDVQERARGPELIGGNQECGFSGSERDIFIPYKLAPQASAQTHNISIWRIMAAAIRIMADDDITLTKPLSASFLNVW